jgi:hypothetical protein
MAILKKLLVASAMILVTSGARAQTEMAGKWICRAGPGNGVPDLKGIPKEAIVAHAIQGFAPKGAQLDLVLVKGGPNGLFVRTHLHGIHKGGGETTFTALGLVQDGSGYNYAAIPRIQMRINGSNDIQNQNKEYHQHCGAQLDFASQEDASKLLALLQSGVSLKISYGASRNRESFIDKSLANVKGLIEQALAGRIKVLDLAKTLNKDKAPSKAK